MTANVVLYNRYARLIVHSFGLQRASDSRKADLPSAFAEVSLVLLHLWMSADEIVPNVRHPANRRL